MGTVPGPVTKADVKLDRGYRDLQAEIGIHTHTEKVSSLWPMMGVYCEHIQYKVATRPRWWGRSPSLGWPNQLGRWIEGEILKSGSQKPLKYGRMPSRPLSTGFHLWADHECETPLSPVLQLFL